TRRLILPEIVELGYVNKGRWRFIAETYVELGLLERTPGLNGFFMEKEAAPWDTREALLPLIIRVAILLAVAAVGLRFYWLSRKRRREEQERMHAETELRAAESRYRGLVEVAPFPITSSDSNTSRIIFVNPRAAQLLGAPREEILGREIRNFFGESRDGQPSH